MKRYVAILLLVMGVAGTAQAAIEAEWGEAPEPSCHHLLTHLECLTHLAQLARLPVGDDERYLYLGQHRALLEDRVQACGCAQALNTAGVLQER